MFNHKGYKNIVGLARLSRHISISQAPVVAVPSPSSSTSSVPKDVTELKNTPEVPEGLTDLEKVLFETIGEPPSSLSIKIPASVPVSIRRGSLISLYTKSSQDAMTATTAQMEVKSPFRRLLLGGITSSYQRIISTVQIDLLISAYTTKSRFSLPFKKETSRTFANLSLDGTVDWIVFPPDGIHCYSGNSLSIRSNRFPSKTSKESVKKFGVKRGTNTGLFSWTTPGYNLVSGRGFVSLLGKGSIFKISLGEEEEILLKRSNILAVSANGINELEDGFFISSALHNNLGGGNAEQEEILPEQIAQEDSFFAKTEYYLKTALSTFRQTKNTVVENVAGNGNYIRISGPRTLLIQSNTGVDQFKIGSSGSSNISKLEKFITDSKNFRFPEIKTGDVLSYATVKDGSVTFRNTPNFDETVKKIEASAQKK